MNTLYNRRVVQTYPAYIYISMYIIIPFLSLFLSPTRTFIRAAQLTRVLLLCVFFLFFFYSQFCRFFFFSLVELRLKTVVDPEYFDRFISLSVGDLYILHISICKCQREILFMFNYGSTHIIKYNTVCLVSQ